MALGVPILKHFRVISHLGRRQSLGKILKIQPILTELSGCLVYVSHNSESQNIRFIDVKTGLYKKRSKGNFVHKNLKKKKKTSLLKM